MLTVDENDGEVVLAVAVQEDRLASNAEVKVKLSTMTGTAGG